MDLSLIHIFPELGQFVKMKISAKALRTINKNGAYNTLNKVGLLRCV